MPNFDRRKKGTNAEGRVFPQKIGKAKGSEKGKKRK